MTQSAGPEKARSDGARVDGGRGLLCTGVAARLRGMSGLTRCRGGPGGTLVYAERSAGARQRSRRGRPSQVKRSRPRERIRGSAVSFRTRTTSGPSLSFRPPDIRAKPIRGLSPGGVASRRGRPRRQYPLQVVDYVLVWTPLFRQGAGQAGALRGARARRIQIREWHRRPRRQLYARNAYSFLTAARRPSNWS